MGGPGFLSGDVSYNQPPVRPSVDVIDAADKDMHVDTQKGCREAAISLLKSQL